MNATLTHPLAVETVDPSEPGILLLLNPATLSDDALLAIRMACEPRNREGDDFRGWLLERVIKENGRRQANSDGTDGEPLEAEAWVLPWHTFNDLELSAALAATFSWMLKVDGEAAEAIAEIHCSVVTAAVTRLREFHTAIEHAQRRKG